MSDNFSRNTSESAPTKQESEVSSKLDELGDMVARLRVTLDELEVRLNPVLPEAQPSLDVKQKPEQVMQGNLCSISRRILLSITTLDDAVCQVRRIINEIRI